jgi:hypothetical protein
MTGGACGLFPTNDVTALFDRQGAAPARKMTASAGLMPNAMRYRDGGLELE